MHLFPIWLPFIHTKYLTFYSAIAKISIYRSISISISIFISISFFLSFLCVALYVFLFSLSLFVRTHCCLTNLYGHFICLLPGLIRHMLVRCHTLRKHSLVIKQTGFPRTKRQFQRFIL